ncbi:MAG: BrnT family toxin [Bryobacterales bacterium]|nr:BrnT family toxin [Bryobacterales bacterium]
MADPLFDFEWDPAKAQTNLSKHGVSFEQATEVFLDPGGCRPRTTSHRSTH